MKIIKYSLIAALGVFFLPAPPSNDFAVMQGGQKINLETGEVIGAAALAYSDVTGFCQRQPGVCNTAGQVLTSFEIRAKYNFRRLYEWSQGTDQAYIRQKKPVQSIKIEQSARLDPIITGSIAPVGKAKLPMMFADNDQNPSVNTLQIEDLLPQWRGPVRSSTG